MEPHRASAHSSILWNVIQIYFLFTFFRASINSFTFVRLHGNHTDYFFRAGARTEPHQWGHISFRFFSIYRQASAYSSSMFGNATTLGLHERACWPDLPGLRMIISCFCTCETCFFFVCVFLFLIFFCLFVVSPYKNITHHMTKLYTPVKTPS